MSEERGYLIGPEPARQLRRLLAGQGQGLDLDQADDPPVVWVRTTSGTASSGWYPCQWQMYDASSDTWTDSGDGWASDCNNAALANNTYYLTQRVGADGSSVPYFLTQAAPAAAGGSIEVKEADGSPDYTGVSILLCDQSTGFKVSQPAGGQAKLEMLPASKTQSGVMITTDQAFAGLKTFSGSVSLYPYLWLYQTTPTGTDNYGLFYFYVSGGILFLSSSVTDTNGYGMAARLEFQHNAAARFRIASSGGSENAQYSVSRGANSYDGVDFSYTFKGDGPDAGFQIALTCTGGIITSKARTQIAMQVVAS